MEQSDEKLCQSICQEMLKYKPSLQEGNTVTDYEAEEQRFVGQTVIKSFPLPIGIELRRLFSATFRNNDTLRLEQLYTTIERSLQLICYILICQLWNEKKLNKIVIPGSFGKIFRQKIHLRNIENYKWIIQSVIALIEERAIEFFVPELRETLNERFISSFEFNVPGKNPDGRFIINMSKADTERNCVEVEEKLRILLQHLAFLVNYKLVSVQQIKVIKPKYQQPKYNHVLKLLTVTDSDFNSFEMQDTKCADSHSVLLTKSQLPLTENLNLSPLVIDTASFLSPDQSAGNIKKDIFLYDGSHDSHMNYRGCRVTEKSDLSALPDYPMLVSQFADMIDSICVA